MGILLRADRLIDGTGAAPVAHAALLVENGRIAQVFATAPSADALPPGTDMLDFPGCTILPGMIDTHVHLNLPGDGSLLEEAMRESDGTLVATSAFSAARALAAGITTVRDVGGARSTVFEMRRALALGHGQGARVLACGSPITITGGHTWPWGGEADGEEALRRMVREMAKRGSDFTKVMATGGGTVGTMSWLPSYSPRELQALADESHRLGRRITAHCLCAEATAMVIDAGFDQIEHCGFLVERSGRQQFVPAVAEKVAASGIPVTGTLAVGGFVLRVMQAKTDRTQAEQAMLDRWLVMGEDNLSQFRKLHAAGVQFVAGTDAGWRFTPIEGLPVELAMMHEGGMPAMEAIVSATGRAAQVIGIDAITGTLTPGLCADVIVVSGDPLADLAALGKIRLVMQDGAIRVNRPA